VPKTSSIPSAVALHAIPACDGQTPGHRKYGAIHIHVAYAPHDKKTVVLSLAVKQRKRPYIRRAAFDSCIIRMVLYSVHYV